MARLRNKEIDILTAAIEVFLGSGFSKTNMKDIADKAQIGKGTIYEYFKNKEDLFLKALEYDHRNLIIEFNEEINKEESFFNKFMKLIETSKNISEKKIGRINYYSIFEISELSAKSQCELRNVLKDMKEDMKNVMYHILEKGIDEGKVKDSEIELDFVIDAMAGMISFHCHKICYENNYSDEQIEEENKKLINLIMSGIGVKK
ncbi:TetR/AcrR family transcriptional regulator [Clostridium beijerinckii]|uniref:AcrR family transcriptional regulator n=1 Tax=Clostridium beijerinckii TaxID=1520 RepID=A0A9Q5GR61_CLOBE|nr:TetR/AcrR family transcriptional regulator [Clostridium beijerinckii]AQS04150.1 fatty acid metabolism regulator protein [Clostridium beijerinckii]MBA2883963.1 AcrR family transcriptional regulator [Clostridium beijerinckii]MBA2899147.1 AcrR family transcriptional regulator [Clostridium beijerinckii]MBA2908549.1 AcrR family transcriptional regulator [Clostridium beijerinckii]MBA9016301.1 AcrR family transcriptional regulator [Clostridium beijerinckii]